MVAECRNQVMRAALAGAALQGVLALGAPSPVLAETPLSAIDWLSDTVSHSAPFHLAPLPRPSGSNQGLMPGVDIATSTGVRDYPITVSTLDASGDLGAGLFPAQRLGLSADFWGATGAAELAARLRTLRIDNLPAAQRMLQGILLAEFDPPSRSDTASAESLFLARVHMLVSFGALEQAAQLITSGAQITPALWHRWFDIALLLGEEDRACASLNTGEAIAVGYPARVFCLARGGDWAAAMLSLQTAESLGAIEPEDAALLRRFLDIDDADTPMSTPPPVSVTPLRWRLLEAVGDPVYTHALPLAFAHADLRGTAGWRAQIDAAERLTRTGALAPNRLLGLYTEARAAASGGIWDRVRAVRQLDAALAGGDPAAIGAALIELWPLVEAGGLEVPFAELLAESLGAVALTGPARLLAFEIALLGGELAIAARLIPSNAGARARFLLALAGDQPVPDSPSNGQAMTSAVAAGFARDVPLPVVLERRIAAGHRGDSALAALDRLADAAQGDLRAVSEALALLRHLGLEQVARRAAVQLILLNRNG